MARAGSHIRRNDQVVVISGKFKGKIGRILQIYPEKGRVLVEKVNMVKKHTKPNQKNRQGGIVEKEASIHISNVMLIDPKTGKGTRISRQVRDGKTVRVSKKSNSVIEIKR